MSPKHFTSNTLNSIQHKNQTYLPSWLHLCAFTLHSFLQVKNCICLSKADLFIALLPSSQLYWLISAKLQTCYHFYLVNTHTPLPPPPTTKTNSKVTWNKLLQLLFHCLLCALTHSHTSVICILFHWLSFRSTMATFPLGRFSSKSHDANYKCHSEVLFIVWGFPTHGQIWHAFLIRVPEKPHLPGFLSSFLSLFILLVLPHLSVSKDWNGPELSSRALFYAQSLNDRIQTHSIKYHRRVTPRIIFPPCNYPIPHIYQVAEVHLQWALNSLVACGLLSTFWTDGLSSEHNILTPLHTFHTVFTPHWEVTSVQSPPAIFFSLLCTEFNLLSNGRSLFVSVLSTDHYVMCSTLHLLSLLSFAYWEQVPWGQRLLLGLFTAIS